MNEIERAIKHFNRVVAQLKYLDGRTDNPYLKDYIRVRNAKNKRRLQASRVALAALREKAEREKGCEACGLIYKLDGASYGTVDELIDNTFCPMCGKRLEVEHEAG